MVKFHYEKIKDVILIFFVLLFIIILILLKFSNRQNFSKKEPDYNNSTAYFNGEVVEITNNSFYLRPTSEWAHVDVSRVKIPITKLFEEDSSTICLGDKIRVACNSNTVDISGDEASIRIVFLLFRLTEDGELTGQ